LRLKVAAMNIISCIFCKCQLPSGEGIQEKYVEHLQGWHMMTVVEEVDRAVQIANAPREVSSSSNLKVQEVSSRRAPKAVITTLSSSHPSSSPLSPVSSSGNLAIQRSPAFSLSSQSCSNNIEVKVDETVSTVGGDRESEKEETKKLVKLKRPRDAQSKRKVACTDCGVKLHWTSLSKHRKRYHPREKLLEVLITPGGGGNPLTATQQIRDEIHPMEVTEAVDVKEWKDLRKFVVISKRGNMLTGDRRTYQCTICGYTDGGSAAQVQMHVERAHFKGSFSYSCDQCAQQFCSKYRLDRHMREKHNRKKRKPKESAITSSSYQKDEETGQSMDPSEVKEWEDLNRFIHLKEKGKRGPGGKPSTLECSLCGRTDWCRAHLMNQLSRNTSGRSLSTPALCVVPVLAPSMPLSVT